MAPDEDSIPRTRARRAAALGRGVGPEAARVATAMARNMARGDEDAARRLAERHLALAQQLVQVLGTMKGAAMKVGQLASFVEADFVPDEFRPLYQEALAQLRDAAPPEPWPVIEKVLVREWEEPVSAVLTEIDPVAAAAASVGQVHRGRLHDGREVAVKVQYPGVEEAIRADLQNVHLLTLAAKIIAPGLDAGALAQEVRERVMEELDYELEATNQRFFARAYRGHALIHVPEVMTSLSRRRVLVCEWVDGEGFDAVRAWDQPRRDRYAEIFYRFYFGSVHRLNAFNADPHPGNVLALSDGRVAFLDFGTVKHMEAARVKLMAEGALAAIAQDEERFHTVVDELGYLAHPDRVTGRRLLESMRAGGSWFLEDREVTIDAPLVRAAIAATSDPRSGFFDVMRHGRMPPDDVLFRRMEASVVSVLAQLDARANWYRIAHEWWAGWPPATPLGEADQAFWA